MIAAAWSRYGVLRMCMIISHANRVSPVERLSYAS